MPIPIPPSRIEDPVHVITGLTPAHTLQLMGGREVIPLHDVLSIGRCDADPGRHLQRRKDDLLSSAAGYRGADPDFHRACLARWVDNILGAHEFIARLSAYPEDRPIVLWTASCWTDSLTYWWSLDALKQAAFDWNRFWVAEPFFPEWAALKRYHPAPHLQSFSATEYGKAFYDLRPLRAAAVRAGASLWQKYARPSPLDFDRARQRGSAFFPDLPLAARVWGTCFSWLRGVRQTRLRLSDVDQVLLDGFQADRWIHPDAVLRGNWRAVECLMEIGGNSGMNRRLGEWVAHTPDDPALLAKPKRGGQHELDSVVYQLTPRGERLRHRGLESPDEVPPMWVGGCRLSADGRTWVRCGTNRHWWIERLDPR